MTDTARQWVLARVPRGQLRSDDFELQPAPDPHRGDDQVTVAVLWLSIDAANRAWMQGPTYRSAVVAGDIMPGFGLAQVLDSVDPRLPPGTLVTGDVGWRNLAVLPARHLTPVADRQPLSHHLSVLGITGLTAYFGLREVGAARPGETVLVSAAAGATGHLVGQIARLDGCRVVGICGSADKQRWLSDQLGFDATVNHRSGDLRAELKAACPDGIDVYFDNVGGPLLDVVLSRMNLHGRVACCGAVSQYDTSTPAPGPSGVPGLLVTKRLRMEGFIVTDFSPRFATAIADLAGWVDDGSLVVAEDVLDGLESAPDGLIGLLAGTSQGKRLIHVADPTAV